MWEGGRGRDMGQIEVGRGSAMAWIPIFAVYLSVRGVGYFAIIARLPSGSAIHSTNSLIASWRLASGDSLCYGVASSFDYAAPRQLWVRSGDRRGSRSNVLASTPALHSSFEYIAFGAGTGSCTSSAGTEGLLR